MAAELVRRQVALIVALAPPSALAAKGATATIPIVFHSGGDVVKMGLVASLNRPGGNATGVNLFTQAVESKRLDVLSKLVPSAETFAYLSHPNHPGAEERANEVRDAARSLGRSLHVIGASTPAEIDAAFTTLVDRRVGALVVMADQYFDDTRRAQLVALPNDRRQEDTTQRLGGADRRFLRNCRERSLDSIHERNQTFFFFS